MADVKLKSFIKGNDIRFTAKYFVVGTTTPNTPDATPTIDIKLDGVSLTGFPQNMNTTAQSHVFDFVWDASGESVAVYLVRFLTTFNSNDVVGELKVELKGENP